MRRIPGKRLNVVALTSCHDRRWDYYKKQAASNLSYEEDSKRRIFSFVVNKTRVYFLDGQEIKGKEGDINIICPGKVLEYEPRTRSVEDLAREGHELGALVSLPHLFGRKGMATEEGKKLVRAIMERGLVDYVETWSSLDFKKHNQAAENWFKDMKKGLKLDMSTRKGRNQEVQRIAVSDGHLDKDVGASYSGVYVEDYKEISTFFDKLRESCVISIEQRNAGRVSRARYFASLARAATFG